MMLDKIKLFLRKDMPNLLLASGQIISLVEQLTPCKWQLVPIMEQVGRLSVRA